MKTTITIYIIKRGWHCSIKEWRFSSYVCIERVRWIIYADRWGIIWVEQLDLKQRSLSSKEKKNNTVCIISLYVCKEEFVCLEMSLWHYVAWKHFFCLSITKNVFGIKKNPWYFLIACFPFKSIRPGSQWRIYTFSKKGGGGGGGRGVYPDPEITGGGVNSLV